MKNVLILNLRPKYLATARLPEKFKEFGIRTISLSCPGSYILRSRDLDRGVIFEGQFDLKKKLLEICNEEDPDFIIPGDDAAIQYLYQLLKNYKLFSPSHNRLKKLILRSCGSKESFRVLGNKTDLLKLAKKLNVRSPRNIPVRNIKAGLSASNSLGYPVVLKSDFGSSGSMVRICRNESDFEKNFKALNAQNRLIQKIRRKFKNKFKELINIPIYDLQHSMAVQDYIEGVVCIHNIFAKEGNVLSCNTLASRVHFPEKTGPSSVVEVIEHEEIRQNVDRIISQSGYTGFASFDFILDKTNSPWLLECNPRPTPTTHLGKLTGGDLLAAFARFPVEQALNCQPDKPLHRIIALFPNEIKREPESIYIKEHFHDVPLKDTELKKFLEKNY